MTSCRAADAEPGRATSRRRSGNRPARQVRRSRPSTRVLGDTAGRTRSRRRGYGARWSSISAATSCTVSAETVASTSSSRPAGLFGSQTSDSLTSTHRSGCSAARSPPRPGTRRRPWAGRGPCRRDQAPRRPHSAAARRRVRADVHTVGRPRRLLRTWPHPQVECGSPRRSDQAPDGAGTPRRPAPATGFRVTAQRHAQCEATLVPARPGALLVWPGRFGLLPPIRAVVHDAAVGGAAGSRRGCAR